MFDHLGADYTVATGIAKWQRKRRSAHDRQAAAIEKPRLGHTQFHADRIVETLDNHAGAATQVEDARGAPRPKSDNSMTPSLPITLERNQAVEGALIIVSGGKGVTQRPKGDRCLRKINSEANQPRM